MIRDQQEFVGGLGFFWPLTPVWEAPGRMAPTNLEMSYARRNAMVGNRRTDHPRRASPGGMVLHGHGKRQAVTDVTGQEEVVGAKGSRVAIGRP